MDLGIGDLKGEMGCLKRIVWLGRIVHFESNGHFELRAIFSRLHIIAHFLIDINFVHTYRQYVLPYRNKFSSSWSYTPYESAVRCASFCPQLIVFFSEDQSVIYWKEVLSFFLLYFTLLKNYFFLSPAFIQSSLKFDWLLLLTDKG